MIEVRSLKLSIGQCSYHIELHNSIIRLQTSRLGFDHIDHLLCQLISLISGRSLCIDSHNVLCSRGSHEGTSALAAMFLIRCLN